MRDPLYEDLSEKEMAVLVATWDGLSMKETAERLQLSVKTVKSRRAAIKDKWHCQSMIAACRLGVQRRCLAV